MTANGGKKLEIGIIGYGGRLSGLVRGLDEFRVPYRVAAIADPRAEEIKKRNDPRLEGAEFYKSAEELCRRGRLDGVMIGTRCNLHARMACKAAELKVPLFLEKPVATTIEDLKMLERTFKDYPAPIVVSFPLRVSPLAVKVRQIVESGRLGDVEHIAAFNDVPYGDVYFGGWYRNYGEVGGLFLQKATHDFDCIFYLAGQKPKRVCAMKSRRIWKGDKPFDLKCRDCTEKDSCLESPFSPGSMIPEGERDSWKDSRMCVFSGDIKNEDCSDCLIEFENGMHANYTQNVFIRHRAARRGARLYGYKATLEFDWYTNLIKIFPHDRSGIEELRPEGEMAHFGGDRELCRDFLLAMSERKPPRTPLAAGIISALACLMARESAETGQFKEVKIK